MLLNFHEHVFTLDPKIEQNDSKLIQMFGNHDLFAQCEQNSNQTFMIHDDIVQCGTEFHPNTLTHDDTAQCERSFIQNFRPMMTLPSVN
jgi:hypothetical protein